MIIKGKVKTVFSTDKEDEVIIQYEDKVTAGNGKKELDVEGKGEVCCQISTVLFKMLEKRAVKTHYLNMPTHKAMTCKKVDIIPIEVVVRNAATGSIVRDTFGIEEGTKFEHPVVEYYLKSDEKDDPLLTYRRINLMGYGKELKEFEYRAQWINKELKKIFHSMSLDLIDFKLEFGYDAKGNLLLADELSPDGMRLWNQGTKESYDKDIFRKEGDGEKMIEKYKEILGSLLQIHARDDDAYNERTMQPEYELPPRGPI